VTIAAMTVLTTSAVMNGFDGLYVASGASTVDAASTLAVGSLASFVWGASVMVESISLS
jgi:hypothetical protein